jgi:hypothetical protein
MRYLFTRDNEMNSHVGILLISDQHSVCNSSREEHKTYNVTWERNFLYFLFMKLSQILFPVLKQVINVNEKLSFVKIDYDLP